MTEKKTGFFQKLFSSKHREKEESNVKTNRSPSTSVTSPDGGGSELVKPKEKRGASGGHGQKKAAIPSVKVDPPPDDKKSPTKKSAPNAHKSKKPTQEKGQKPTEGGIKKKRLSRKKSKKSGAKGDVAPADPNQRLEFPTTPEMILAVHKSKPFLDKNEEWLVVELNEYECLVENLDIIKTIANHSKFFEVEPDQLWEEFFEYVEEMPSYDEVINYDVWQEFRDEKYPC